jgi:predicted ATPase
LEFAAQVRQFRREGPLTQERAEAQIALSREQGFPFRVASGTVLKGWALSEQGYGEEGIAQLRQGIAGVRATGAEVATPHWLALLAEAYGRDGQNEEGLKIVGEALAIVDKNAERYYEAELYRLKGELLLAQSRRVGNAHQPVSNAGAVPVGCAHPTGEGEAEECFLKAIDLARDQQAKSLELRAVMSLSRLWQQQGKQKEAHAMLANIYNWFTEGLDTKDLQDAKALLEELS